MMVRRIIENLYQVEWTAGWWLWRKDHRRQAYWWQFSDNRAGWYWADNDELVEDFDVRIALNEADLAWKLQKEKIAWLEKIERILK